MTMPEAISSEIQKLAPSAVVELFELDSTSIGGEIIRFHAGTNELRQNVIWQGNTYLRYPVQADGFEVNANGQLPRPKLTVSNVLGTVTALILAYQDLLGCKVTRKRTLAKYLDAANFEGGVNPTEDDTAAFPDDVYYIDRKASETKDYVSFELASVLDLAGVKLPRRQIIQNLCVWQYRGAECGYSGPPTFDTTDQPLGSASTPEGQAVVDAHEVLRVTKHELATAESILKNQEANKSTACALTRAETRYNSLYYYHELANGSYQARWNGNPVTIGSTYRIGTFQVNATSEEGGGKFYRIERWAGNSSACTSATTSYNNALTNRNNAADDVENAQAAFDAAVADLPEDDPLYTQDRCGKRLTSCKSRFGENAELPFGAFPSSGYR